MDLEKTSRSKERREARVFRLWKETVEEYFYDKAAMHRRAEPFMAEIEVMREVWKGRHPDLMVVSWKQHKFRDELIQRYEMAEEVKRRSCTTTGMREIGKKKTMDMEEIKEDGQATGERTG